MLSLMLTNKKTGYVLLIKEMWALLLMCTMTIYQIHFVYGRPYDKCDLVFKIPLAIGR